MKYASESYDTDGQVEWNEETRKMIRDKDKVLQIINSNIQMLNAGHVKEGLREATKEEIEFSTALLQAVAADIEALEQ